MLFATKPLFEDDNIYNYNKQTKDPKLFKNLTIMKNKKYIYKKKVIITECKEETL